MRKRRLTSLLASFVLLLCFCIPAFPVSAEEISLGNTDASIVSGCHTADAQVPLRSDILLEVGKAGILYEVNSHTLVYGENIDLQVYPGSFVKLMTALLAVEQGNPEDTITISQDTLDRVPENSSITGLLAGEEVTLEQLMYCLILDSANDAAVVIAEHIAGSQEAFVEAMNQRAAELGCTGTHYCNVHGVHDDQQYTTARDLVKIMECALQYDWFVNVISTEQYNMAATNMSPEERLMNTDNYMLSQTVQVDYYDSRVTGGKSATNQDGERSVIVTAKGDGLYYVGIVMDAKPDLATDGTVKVYRQFLEMEKLLDLGFDNYEAKQILYEGQVVSSVSVPNGENSVAVGPTTSVASVLPKNVGLNELTLRYQRNGGALNAPVEKGQTLDLLQVWYGNICIAQSELVAMNSSAVAAVSLVDAENSSDLDTSGFTKALAVFGIIVGVLVGIAAVLYIVRTVRRVMAQAKRRRRRSSRRRSR